MRQPASYRDRVVKRLRALVESRGASIQSVEKRLGRGRGYVNDGLRGAKKLSFDVILEVLEAVGVKPEEFFEQATLPPVTRGPGAAPELDKDRPVVETLPPELRDSPPLIQAIVLLLAEKGVVGLDELQERQRDLGPTGTGSARPVADAGAQATKSRIR